MMPQGRERTIHLLGKGQVVGAGATAIYTLPNAPAGRTAVITDIFVDRNDDYAGVCHIIFDETDIAAQVSSPSTADIILSYNALPSPSATANIHEWHHHGLNIGIVEPGGGLAGWCPTAGDEMTIHIFGYVEDTSHVA